HWGAPWRPFAMGGDMGCPSTPVAIKVHGPFSLAGWDMRKVETIEKLYLDFDGFFASVMQQAHPRLRGKPVAVIPFEVEGRGADSTCVIACSKEAKAYGVKNVMSVPEARTLCPGIILVPQKPDLFRRANA